MKHPVVHGKSLTDFKGITMETAIHTITTPSLAITYEQTGPDSGEPVVLLHGFPYDVRSFDDVLDRLKAENRRLIVPYLRGFGPTLYREPHGMRSGQQAALGRDVIDLLDALKIEQATLMGFDWGGRAACAAAALWPERVRALVSVGGYTIQDIAESAAIPAAAEQEHQFWYQWYFQTERGRNGLEQHRAGICRLLWRMWSPTWRFEEDHFAATARSFDNPDFVATVIHSYRHRYANAAGDPTLDGLEKRLADRPRISSPAIVLYGKADQVDPPPSSYSRADLFSRLIEERFLDRVGHCTPKEAPDAVSQAIEGVMHMAMIR
jgi:pimeloyl-ACP methyl ester carboxylesterase